MIEDEYSLASVRCYGNLPLNLVQIVSSADLVVVMTKFVSHKVTDAIPLDKRHFIRGGLTDLRRYLSSLVPAMKTNKTITLHDPSSRHLIAAATGEIIRYVFLSPYKEPKSEFDRIAEREEKAMWLGRINASRNYVKNKYGIITEQAVLDDEVLVSIELNPSVRKANIAKPLECIAESQWARLAPTPAPEVTPAPPASGLGPEWARVYKELCIAALTGGNCGPDTVEILDTMLARCVNLAGVDA